MYYRSLRWYLELNSLKSTQFWDVRLHLGSSGVGPSSCRVECLGFRVFRRCLGLSVLRCLQAKKTANGSS